MKLYKYLNLKVNIIEFVGHCQVNQDS